MGKKTNWIQIIIFTAFIGIIFILNLILPDREFSEVENRYLTQMPKFTFENFVFGSFTTDFEKYASDQFVMRDGWITVKAATELAAGKGENNDVYYCGNGTLIERFIYPEESRLEKDADYINSLVENVNVPVYLAIIPGAAEIWKGKLPVNAPNDSEKQLIDKVYSETKAIPVDMYSALNAHKDDYIFYHTDHHWTSLGAYYGYTAVMDAMGCTPDPIEHYNRTVMSTSFLGTVYSASGFTWVKPDTIETFVQAYDGLKITNYSSGKPEDGTLYDLSFLNKKDKYSMFYGGITPLLEIDTGHEDLPSLLIIRDSYTDSLSPFLLEHFSKIHILDLRYYNTKISQYIASNAIDTVLICYSAGNFSTDTNLYKLAK
ncbi:MAG: DHHW family protein [Oscillospiraceae bacterium]